jgi:hypothetical protein
MTVAVLILILALASFVAAVFDIPRAQPMGLVFLTLYLIVSGTGL